jgi:hypothetical protein
MGPACRLQPQRRGKLVNRWKIKKTTTTAIKLVIAATANQKAKSVIEGMVDPEARCCQVARVIIPLIRPPVLEVIGRQCRVFRRVVDVLVPHVPGK